MLTLARTGAATNRLITAKDHASVQINVADVDEDGRMIPGGQKTYAFCGFVRREGQSDDSLNRLATNDGRASRFAWLAGKSNTDDRTVLKNVFSSRQ